MIVTMTRNAEIEIPISLINTDPNQIYRNVANNGFILELRPTESALQFRVQNITVMLSTDITKKFTSVTKEKVA